MILYDLLNYRNNCLLCRRKMILKSTELAGIIFYETKDGLKAKLTGRHNVFVHFKFDGSYKNGKKASQAGLWSLYTRPLTVTKFCPICDPHPQVNPVTTALGFKARSVSVPYIGPTGPIGPMGFSKSPPFTTLDNIKNPACAYSFTLYTQGDKYEGQLQYEFIGATNKEEFCHLSNDFTTGKSTAFYSKWNKKLDDMMTLHLPAISTSNINNMEQLIHKIKMYNMFS